MRTKETLVLHLKEMARDLTIAKFWHMELKSFKQNRGTLLQSNCAVIKIRVARN